MSEARHIGFELKCLSNQIRRSIDESVANSGLLSLTGMQAWIIGYLERNQSTQEVFQRDLEKKFNVRGSTMTGILKLMEKNGLIVRQEAAHDARMKKLVLTEQSLLLQKMLRSRIDELEARMIMGLSPQELEQFFNTLAKIKKNIE